MEKEKTTRGKIINNPQSQFIDEQLVPYKTIIEDYTKEYCLNKKEKKMFSRKFYNGNREIIHERIDELRKYYSNVADEFEIYLEDLNNKCKLKYFQAIDNDDLKKVKKMINLGFNIDTVDENGMSGLMHATDKGNVQMVKLLIHKGADVNINYFCYKNSDIMSALSIALKKNYDEMIHILRDAGAGLYEDLKDAIINRNIEKVEQLIKKGANVNRENVLGETPLLLALSSGDAKLVKMLIDYGVEVYHENIFGNNVYDQLFGSISIIKCKYDIIKLLIDKDDLNYLSGQIHKIEKLAKTYGRQDIIDLIQYKMEEFNKSLR